jgi:hypothetical protein
MVRAIAERPVVEDGVIVVRKVIHMRYSFDERIDDALNCRLGFDAVNRVIEDPELYLGAVGQDQAEAVSLLETGETMRTEAEQRAAA